jgi:hypothetical protein
MSSVQPSRNAGTSVCVPRMPGSPAPSAWMRRKRRAPARFAIRARAMLPMETPAVFVLVITTLTPAR